MAALAVAVHHSIPDWHQYKIVARIGIDGYLGVPFFFLLSGFVMMWTWHHGGKSHFLAKRAARIYPVVVFGLGVSLLAYACFGNAGAGHAGPKISVLYNLLLVQAWFSNDPLIRQSWDGVAWTLSCEAFFYVIGPVILRALSAPRVRTCAITIVAMVATDFALQAILLPRSGSLVEDFFLYSPVANLPIFLAGALMCRVVMSGGFPSFNLSIVTLLGVILPFALYFEFIPLVQRYNSLAEFWMAPGFLVLIGSAASRDLRSQEGRRLMTSRPLVWGGEISYSFYMTHALLLGALVEVARHRFLPSTPLAGEVFLCGYLVCATVAAGIVHRVVEIPGQRVVLALLTGNGISSALGGRRHGAKAVSQGLPSSQETPSLP